MPIASSHYSYYGIVHIIQLPGFNRSQMYALTDKPFFKQIGYPAHRWMERRQVSGEPRCSISSAFQIRNKFKLKGIAVQPSEVGKVPQNATCQQPPRMWSAMVRVVYQQTRLLNTPHFTQTLVCLRGLPQTHLSAYHVVCSKCGPQGGNSWGCARFETVIQYVRPQDGQQPARGTIRSRKAHVRPAEHAQPYP